MTMHASLHATSVPLKINTRVLSEHHIVLTFRAGRSEIDIHMDDVSQLEAIALQVEAGIRNYREDLSESL